jgi:hypothetical protein
MRTAMSETDSMGIIPTTRVPTTDEVIDAIAEIEMQRRETEKAAGIAMSCSSALHRLNELLEHETEALRLRGPDSGHAENIEAVRMEIGRIKGLNGATGRGPTPKNAYRGERKASWQDASHGPGRTRGRRTMGRAGGR